MHTITFWKVSSSGGASGQYALLSFHFLSFVMINLLWLSLVILSVRWKERKNYPVLTKALFVLIRTQTIDLIGKNFPTIVNRKKDS